MRVMTVKDMKNLRGSANPDTHLARYEAAHEKRYASVLSIWCPQCGREPGNQCVVRKP